MLSKNVLGKFIPFNVYMAHQFLIGGMSKCLQLLLNHPARQVTTGLINLVREVINYTYLLSAFLQLS